MDRVRFCKHCGELMEGSWLHCPWCGEETRRENPGWTAIIDDSMDRVELSREKGHLGLLDDLSGRLDLLESELDAFLASRS